MIRNPTYWDKDTIKQIILQMFETSQEVHVQIDIHQGVSKNLEMRKHKLPLDNTGVLREMGSIGGRPGCEARADKLSPERRREIAREAVEARLQGTRKHLNEARK
jgi:hypothetical protein